jgi:general secretion pathway protein G
MVNRRTGFTLIELLVVMAVIATLLTLAIPRYFSSVDRSKEAVLRENLNTVRDAIDKFHADRGRYPDSLPDLVTKRYLRSVPMDPIAESDSAWVIVPPPQGVGDGAVYDVRSGAQGSTLDGKAYSEL